MRKKMYLAALALPLAFASCSQEDLFEGAQNNAQQGTVKATFVVENAAASATRADWADDKMSFVPTDKFSLYWLGAGKDADLTYAEVLSGYTNAVYAQTEPGLFQSQSLIFEGKNIAVFPADLAHYSVKNIDIKIDAEQTAKTVENLPYISNVLNIQAHTNSQDNNKPGYEVKVKMAIKQAANVFDMTLNLKNHTELLKNPFNLEVQKVELIANANAFANEAKVVAVDAEPTNKGEIKWKVGNTEHKANTIVKQAEVSAEAATTTLTSKAITKVQDGVYTVRFVVLPTDVEDLTEGSEIKVYTNCGTVTLSSAEAAYPEFKDDEAGKKAEAEYLKTAGDLFTNKAGNKFAIAEIFETVASYAKNTSDADFKNEKVGRVVKRSIVVDMAKADLSSVDVENEEQLMRYVTLYNLIKKEDLMTLNLVGKGNEFTISAATAKAVAELEAKVKNVDNIALNNAAKTVIVLSTAGEVYSIPELSTAATYKLAAGEWTMNDNATFNQCANIATVKDATLTITGTVKNKVQQELAIDLTNAGTLKIGGDELNVASTIISTGVIEIEDAKILNFIAGSEASKLGGTVNVYEQLYTTIAGVALTGTVNNYYIIGADAKAGVGFVNEGTINVKETAIATYIHDNQGTINLNKRNDEVVTSAGNEGKIVYNWNDGETLTKVTGDKFTYLVVKQANLTIGNNLAAVDVEFATGADCKIVASQSKGVHNVLVNKDAAVHLLSGNYLTCNIFENNGSLTLGGTIDTFDGTLAGNGKVITVSGGQVK